MIELEYHYLKLNNITDLGHILDKGNIAPQKLKISS